MAEKEKWLTLENKKRVKINKEGEVIAGFSGFMGKNISTLGKGEEIKKYSPPRKSLAVYLSEGNDGRKSAEQYFKDNLKNTYVTTNVNGKDIDVHFTRNTYNKLRNNLFENPELVYFIDELPNVLQNFLNAGGNTKPREDYDGFYYFEKKVTKTIPLKGKNSSQKISAKIKIDVGIRKDGKEFFEAYSTSKKIVKDKKINCIFEYRRCYQQENPAAATVGISSTHQKCSFDKNIPQQGEIVNIDIQILEGKAMDRQNILMDSKSKRSIDRNGFMHVELCSITKESVDPYFGREIPKHKELGLVPDRIYYGWRKGEELEKAAKTFCGLPLMRDHHMDSSENP